MKLNAFIDHTALKPTIKIEDVYLLCDEAKVNGFAAVCIPPLFVKAAKEKLAGSDIKVATVIGFPFGYAAVESKVAELVLAILDGADELDVVINFTAIKNNDWQYVANEINTLMSIVKAKQKVIKVIIESGELTPDEVIKCCDIYGMAGVDYLKTSTGFASRGATIEDVKLIRAHLADNIKIKASGGVKDYQFAKALIDAGASRIGCSASLQIINDPHNV